jgi:prophage antirepressor-like protein
MRIGVDDLTLLSESGLYKIIMRSDKPTARPFQDWVTKEVLPVIKKVGVTSWASRRRPLSAERDHIPAFKE